MRTLSMYENKSQSTDVQDSPVFKAALELIQAVAGKGVKQPAEQTQSQEG